MSPEPGPLSPGLLAAADMVNMWMRASEGYAETASSKADPNRALRMQHYAHAYRALEKALRARALVEERGGAKLTDDDDTDPAMYIDMSKSE